MDGRTTLSLNLRRIRVAKGISQERLAYDSGMDRSYVSGIERGIENPTIDVIDRLAKVLEISIDQLLVTPSGRKPSEGLRRGRKPKEA
ncbi:MAG: helix-turn-helix transcriptional regulator [Phreatobacter sp.]|uniref:helix-turn-helix domain-containing protein n=1 Tax=Phreatobacter sp. TaxID=1966341 RepID=UPI001A62123A|nr:helix-turn-helix transcriptional regulator [Phreatobacter sp.]MBL8570041.1 helix-turn-helix transcriptional regulator [Phreatobacter sp.]